MGASGVSSEGAIIFGGDLEDRNYVQALRVFGVNGNFLLFLSESLKCDEAVDKREERIISPSANIIARMNSRPTLAHNDTASRYEFSSEGFDAKSLSLAVAPVS